MEVCWVLQGVFVGREEWEAEGIEVRITFEEGRWRSGWRGGEDEDAERVGYGSWGGGVHRGITASRCISAGRKGYKSIVYKREEKQP